MFSIKYKLLIINFSLIIYSYNISFANLLPYSSNIIYTAYGLSLQKTKRIHPFLIIYLFLK